MDNILNVCFLLYTGLTPTTPVWCTPKNTATQKKLNFNCSRTLLSGLLLLVFQCSPHLDLTMLGRNICLPSSENSVLMMQKTSHAPRLSTTPTSLLHQSLQHQRPRPQHQKRTPGAPGHRNPQHQRISVHDSSSMCTIPPTLHIQCFGHYPEP